MPRPDRFNPGKVTRHLRYRRLRGLQGRSGRVRKITPTPGFDPRTVKPVASRYTNYINDFTMQFHTRLFRVCQCSLDRFSKTDINMVIRFRKKRA